VSLRALDVAVNLLEEIALEEKSGRTLDRQRILHVLDIIKQSRGQLAEPLEGLALRDAIDS